MRVLVDRNICESHGQCVLIAEDIFHFNQQAVLEYEPHPDESRRVDVEEAADLCPVQAIRLDPV